ncbi:MAG: hypothetical protein FWC27_13010 [Firmicutes bacterium]|nr:hypothetical protein [Bacillota bacterium]
MKKSLKRGLAAFLAALMVLGLGTAASAAPAKKSAGPPRPYESASSAAEQAAANGTVSITAWKPEDNKFMMHLGELFLTGLEVSVSGGIFTAPAAVKYNDVGGDVTQKQDKILWDFWVESPDAGWAAGENTAALWVRAYKCTVFHPVTEDGGTQYGYFEQELVFEASTPIKVIVLPFDLGAAATVLGLAPATGTVRLSDGYDAETFKFTAPQDGYYSFKSAGGQYGGTFYSKDGAVLERGYVDPWAELYDKDGYYLAGDDDRGGDWNFAVYQQLKAGDVVYLLVGGYAWPDDTDITVTITRMGAAQPALALKSNDITVNFHESIGLDALLEGTGYGLNDLRVDYDWDYIDYWWSEGMFALKRGVTTLTLDAPDGSAAQVKVTIRYSAMQWLCAVLLGGWAWLPFTSYGPFNLAKEIKLLFDYGLLASLRELFFHWRYGLLYRWRS